MEAVIITAVVALANIACFMIGVKTGMAVAKDEPIVLNVPRAFDYTKQEAHKEADIQHKKLETILQNIDSYDGTSNGQKDIL